MVKSSNNLYELLEKPVCILKLCPEDRFWTFIKCIHYESLIYQLKSTCYVE